LAKHIKRRARARRSSKTWLARALVLEWARCRTSSTIKTRVWIARIFQFTELARIAGRALTKKAEQGVLGGSNIEAGGAILAEIV
jgi:hypothetical protein